MDIQFAQPSEVKQPVNKAVIHTERSEGDEFVGASSAPKQYVWKVLQPNGQWSDFIPSPELQRNIFGDTWSCVSFSKNNIYEFLHKRQYGVEINLSDRFLAVGSGTVRGKGNSKNAVYQFGKNSGFLYEVEMPYLESMSLDEYFAKPTTQDYSLALTRVSKYDYDIKWLADNSPKTLKMGLTFSPIWVDVESYSFDANGYIKNTNTAYIHEVVIFGYEEGKCWYVCDSENKQFLKFSWWYDFNTPAILAFNKKPMGEFYKLNGTPTIYVKHWSQNILIPFSDGWLAGGDLFKTLYGITDYSQLNINHVNALPYPVADSTHNITTK